MSEQKQRSVEEIRQEYSSLCARAGHIQYQAECLRQDLELVNKSLKDLNFEAAAAAKREAEAKAAESPKLEAVPTEKEEG